MKKILHLTALWCLSIYSPDLSSSSSRIINLSMFVHAIRENLMLYSMDAGRIEE